MSYQQTLFRRLYTLAGAAALALATGQAAAIGLNVMNGNSSIDVDPSGDYGLNLWQVDGTNQMYLEWFWYRLEGDTQESNLADLGSGTGQASGNQIVLNYGSTADPIAAQLTYTLTGGAPGSGSSQLGERLRITNNSTAPVTLSLFEYTDFDLNDATNNDGTNDGVMYLGPDTILQFDNTTPGYGYTRGWVTVQGPAPTAWQTGIVTYPSILDSLTDGAVTELNNTAVSLTGPDDYEFAFEWKFTLAPSQNIEINKTKYIAVPEPTTLALLGLGLAGLGRCRRKI